jgi:hypothetical protein
LIMWISIYLKCGRIERFVLPGSAAVKLPDDLTDCKKTRIDGISVRV